MLFFRRRDTSSETHLTDQERCIHACLFFVFIGLLLTIVFFYFAITFKGPDDQRFYYYLSAGICLSFLILLSVGTVLYIRRFYTRTCSSKHQHRIATDSEYISSKPSATHT